MGLGLSIVQETTDEEGTTEPEATEEDERKVIIESVRAELEAKFSSNVIALQTVLEKVENPKAKVLAKNGGKAKFL